jgi:hypothetical protein
MVDLLMSYNPLFAGSTFNGNSAGIGSLYENGTGSTIIQGAPVSVNGSGQLVLTDVTSSASVQAFVGFAGTAIAPSAFGQVVSNGRLQNLTGYSFSVGNAIYIGIGGIIQNTQPNYGVTGFAAGDTVVFCGVIVNNTTNPSNQDLMILTQVVGVL